MYYKLAAALLTVKTFAAAEYSIDSTVPGIVHIDTTIYPPASNPGIVRIDTTIFPSTATTSLGSLLTEPRMTNSATFNLIHTTSAPSTTPASVGQSIATGAAMQQQPFVAGIIAGIGMAIF